MKPPTYIAKLAKMIKIGTPICFKRHVSGQYVPIVECDGGYFKPNHVAGAGKVKVHPKTDPTSKVFVKKVRQTLKFKE